MHCGDMLAQQLSVGRGVPPEQQQLSAIFALPCFLLTDAMQSSESGWQLELPDISNTGSPVTYQMKTD